MVHAENPTDELINEACSEDDKILMGEIYEDLIRVFNKWLDVKDEYLNILALWVIGTYIHNSFNSYPILFINATKGSGKSRLLRLLAELCNGKLTNSISEPVMFRTKGMLALDEFERVGNKEKQMLRELLNSAYKKGVKVIRMKEKRLNGAKDYEAEEFEVYRPVVMANIWGMDEVLSDRCITLILEKSSDPRKIKLIENFELDPTIQKLKKSLVECSLCNVVSEKMYREGWNYYILDKYRDYTNSTNYINYTQQQDDILMNECSSMKFNIHLHTTLTTNTTLINNNNINTKSLSFFNKLDQENIFGRNLEIFFPLLLISFHLNEIIFDSTLKISSSIIYEKNKEDQLESLDLILIDFISKFEESLNYYSIRDLLNKFREFSNVNDDFLNERWMGRALKRLCLVTEKKRVSSGIMVLLNVAKAKTKKDTPKENEMDK